MSQSGSREDEAIQQRIGKRVKTKSIGQPDPMDAFLSLYEPAAEGDEYCIDDDSALFVDCVDSIVADDRNIQTNIPPEVEIGRREYKLQLIRPTEERFKKLVTQMKWRLGEGQGEAIYDIGVTDNGALTGLNKDDMDESLSTLRSMASTIGASTAILRRKSVSEDLSVMEVLVRKIPDGQNCIEIRVAVMGNVDAGKSTLIGVLTQGSLDDGSGAARVNLFRHAHEIKSGNTSSISNEILGFDQEGNEINYRNYINAEEICMKSAKIVKFIDLAGHEKYMHTTIRGVTMYAPHYAMLVVNGSTGVVGTTRDHLGLAFALEVPVFVVITKADLALPHINETLEHLEGLLKSFGIRKVPLR